ncbi:hypothetical protein MPLB_2300029 [Mesorhizobium sp. ORS 3324]|nr:hypothetical protein MPLB_2300029 [Mesorhizobium sp. ORS 3324]
MEPFCKSSLACHGGDAVFDNFPIDAPIGKPTGTFTSSWAAPVRSVSKPVQFNTTFLTGQSRAQLESDSLHALEIDLTYTGSSPRGRSYQTYLDRRFAITIYSCQLGSSHVSVVAWTIFSSLQSFCQAAEFWGHFTRKFM